MPQACMALLLILLLNCYANVKPNPIEGCKRIQGMPGPEDLAIDRETGILYVWGSNNNDQLGLGRNIVHKCSPKKNFHWKKIF